MITAAFLGTAFLALGQAEAPSELYQDLRNKTTLLPGLLLVGPSVQKYTFREPEGLRVTLPAKREKLATVAVQTKFSFAGDFEITAAYELLAADAPEGAAAIVGVNLFVIQGEDEKISARLGRFNTATDGHIYEAKLLSRNPDRASTTRRFPTDQKAGQFRIVRRGSALSYFVKDAKSGDEFTELLSADFGVDDIKRVRFVVNTSEQPCAVDVRLMEFRIITGSLPPGTTDIRTGPAPVRSYWWLIPVAGVVVVGGIGVLIQRWGRRRQRASVVAQEEPAPAARKSSEVDCPSCAKRIRISERAVGKKVRCPACAAVFAPVTSRTDEPPT